MDSSKHYHNISPENSANLVSKLLFWWTIPFFNYGYKNDLKIKNVYNVMSSDRSEYLTNELEKNWTAVKAHSITNKVKPSLLIAIRKTFWKSFMVVGIIIMLRNVLYAYFMPIVLSQFIGIFNESPRDITKGSYLGATVIIMNFLNCLIAHQGTLYTRRIGMRVRVACCSLMYRKVLKLNKNSLNTTDAGMLVNLLSNDVNRLDFAASVIHFIWIMPIQAAIGTYVMYSFVGPIAFVAIGAMIFQAVPVQGYLSRIQGQLRKKIASKTDHRMKVTNEILSQIQMIKMYVWEKQFQKVVTCLRKCEINLIKKTSYIKGISTSVQVFTERVSLYLIVVTYILTGNKLTSNVVFAISQAVNFLQLIVCIMFPMATASYAETKVSISRIETFLLKDEWLEEGAQKSNMLNVLERGSVKLSNVCASWIPNREILKDLSLQIEPGSLCCISGNVGSGKTSILQLLIRELLPQSGNVDINGSISYVSQKPWIFDSTVKKNILFGQDFAEGKYNKVIAACALEKDIKLFLHGDDSCVGEKGMSLSGGQKARINLARGVYKDADIYLLDDPLSAVDPNVANHIVKNCILNMLRDKTRILVTHQKQFLKHADVIIFLKDGKVERFLKSHELSDDIIDVSIYNNNNNIDSDFDYMENIPQKSSPSQFDNTLSNKNNSGNNDKEKQELIAKGLIPFSIYRRYYEAGANIFLLLCAAILFISAQSFCVGSDLWITSWTNYVDQTNKEHGNISELSSSPSNNNSTSIDSVHQSDPLNIQIYTFLIVAAVLLTISRSILFYKICMKASSTLHNLMLGNVMRSKLRFFNTNSSGNILNRFSKDMGTIDEQLPSVTLMSLQVILIGIGILVLIIMKSPMMIIPTIIIGIFVIWFRNIFLKSSQDLKRLEGITKSPLFSYVTSSLNGLSTIRSANVEGILMNEFDNLQDQHTSTWYLLLVLSDAFGFFLNAVTICLLFALTFQFLIDDNAMGGDVGLLVTQSFIIIGVLQLGARNTADVATHMTSVERVLQYTDLDEEEPFESITKPPIDWPSMGEIRFEKVNLTYSTEEGPILKNLTISIKPGEKVGIVGRTGAGKSSLISALFRLAPVEGVIEIDGINTENIGLQDLRNRISVIPQDPVLFCQDIRYNLDPLCEFDDEVLWKVLSAVDLKYAVESLDMKIEEGGSNLSVGQRQLICIARVLLKNNRILIMDEATANVDPNTDALILKAIRHNFKHCTVLTVAHRLTTVLDSDKIIVMDAGQIKEYGSPQELLEIPTSFLTRMVSECELKA